MYMIRISLDSEKNVPRMSANAKLQSENSMQLGFRLPSISQWQLRCTIYFIRTEGNLSFILSKMAVLKSIQTDIFFKVIDILVWKKIYGLSE